MTQANNFRRNAETCVAMAGRAEAPAECELWLARAARWIELAAEAEAKPADTPLTPGAPRLPPAPPPWDETDGADPGSAGHRAA